ncbi:hypothetical protein B9T13_04610 [Wohlfahrtiimonas chitiniclastica]|uniref:AAA family ATPase n=1 Tax=Wohlfahrtiimonas chitiniclastica TaxID=400946 RepID=UPI000B9874A2|nr:AAA family ATPase [Wohlfahrtiimonas chitiniclastica]OYQ70545.1 hypothetical protein B9T13_04610 [Wohlfahrtiimonas chitiniclastica]
MNLDIEIKNLGKIKQANFKINKFTILAGVNSSGKSFITKALYSFFSTINKDFFYLAHIDASRIIILNIKALGKKIESINGVKQELKDLFVDIFSKSIQLREIIDDYDVVSPFMEENVYTLKINDCVDQLQDLVNLFETSCGSAAKKYQPLIQHIDFINKQLRNIRETIDRPLVFLAETYSDHFTDALKENFQAKNLSSLSGDSISSPISFHLKDFGTIQINGDSMDFELARKGIETVRDFNNVVFIESPVYWKLKGPLLLAREEVLYRNASLGSRKLSNTLSGVPKYFYDLIDLISLKYKSKNSQELLSIKEIITNILGGEIIINDNNELFFDDKNCNKKIDLNLTASGINNLGLLALLLEKNIITEGSFVFLDEPEVNLHPAWQKIMIEVLYKLSLNGVNIVIATHSQDMIKYLETIMDDLDSSEVDEHFSVLHLKSSGISIDSGKSTKNILYSVKEDLGQSYHEMTLASGALLKWLQSDE